MKTYTEVRNKQPFDWNRFLKNVIRRKTPLPLNEFKQVFDLSADWVTCACGTMCYIIPRGGDDGWDEAEPQDIKLRDLGIIFSKQISCKQWSKAKITLAKIEARSAKLINRELEIIESKLNAIGYKIVPMVGR